MTESLEEMATKKTKAEIQNKGLNEILSSYASKEERLLKEVEQAKE
jgi:hypothetical protein